MFGATPWSKIREEMTGRGKPNTVTYQYQLTMIKLIRTQYSCTYISMHMPVKDIIIFNRISTEKMRNFRYFFSVKVEDQVITQLTSEAVSVNECNSSIRCSKTLPDVTEVYMFLYICIIKKVQLNNNP